MGRRRLRGALWNAVSKQYLSLSLSLKPLSLFSPSLSLSLLSLSPLSLSLLSLERTRARSLSWDPETSRERVGDWGGPETVWALLCVAARRATSPNGECCPAFVVCGAVIPGDLVTRQQFRARQHLFVQWRMGRRYSTRRHVLEPERPEAV